MSKTVLRKGSSFLQRPNRLSTVLASISGCWETPEGGPVEYERRENVAVRLDEANDEVEAAMEDMMCTMHQNEESKFTLQRGMMVIHRSPSIEASQQKLKDAPDDATVALTVHLHSIVTRGKDIWKLTDQERLEMAQKHKDKGSSLFKEKHYRGAAIRYSKAVKYLATATDGGVSESPELEEMLKLRTLCLLNLAASQLQLNLQDYVVVNCGRVLQVEPTNVKALYRRAKALLSMKDFEAARQDLKKAKELDPASQAITDLTKMLDSQERALLNRYGDALKGMFR